MLSTKVSCNSHGENSSYFLGWKEYERNPYHPSLSPNGIIQMGLAENQLSFDLIESWLESHPEAAGFKKDGALIFRELALFQDYHGLPAFKNAMCEFMSDLRGSRVKFDPNNLVLTAGATSANETLIFCLAEPGEAFLLPTPYYPGFDRDLKWRTGVEIVPVSCTSSNGFKVTKQALEDAYHQARKQNLRVKGVLITNPSNPLGTTATRHELNILIDFIESKGIHLISDEIYSGTVFDFPGFISVREIVSSRSKVSDRVHIVYSLSKDLGLPGFRIGAIYSTNNAVTLAATRMSSFGLISSQTQYLLSVLLSDREFTKRYVRDNRKRLKVRHDMLVDGLAMAGVDCLESNAGLFCWIDMRKLMKKKTFEGEIELWKKMIYVVGLNISPGSSCHCSEPGWFRVCFANMSEETLRVALCRMRDFVGDGDNDTGMMVRRRLQSPALSKWVLRLSVAEQRKPGR